MTPLLEAQWAPHTCCCVCPTHKFLTALAEDGLLVTPLLEAQWAATSKAPEMRCYPATCLYFLSLLQATASTVALGTPDPIDALRHSTRDELRAYFASAVSDVVKSEVSTRAASVLDSLDGVGDVDPLVAQRPRGRV